MDSVDLHIHALDVPTCKARARVIKEKLSINYG